MAEPELNHELQDLSDRIALFITQCLRIGADLCFAKRYGHRAVVLETVAAVPGMIGATITHLHCLRRRVDDDGWLRTLMGYFGLYLASRRTAHRLVGYFEEEAVHCDVNHGLATAQTQASRPPARACRVAEQSTVQTVGSCSARFRSCARWRSLAARMQRLRPSAQTA